MNRGLRTLLHAPDALYRRGWGFLLGHRFCAVTHVGRHSGRRFQTVLEVLEYRPEDRMVFVLSGLGRRADWLRNIEAAPALRLQIGREDFAPVHCLLPADRAAAVLAGYERRNRLLIPVLRRVLSRLGGLRYDGSDSARLELVRRLPVVGFRPAPGASAV